MPRKKKKRKRRYFGENPRNERQEDILSIFSEAQRLNGGIFDDESGYPVVDGGHIICPPWREAKTDGELGPWYGPESAAALEVVLERWRTSLEGGGLWDHAQEPIPEVSPKPAPGRADTQAMRAFIAQNSGAIPNRELEAYVYFWEKQWSLGKIAKKMGFRQNSSAGDLIKRLRKRMKDTVGQGGSIEPRIRKP